MNTDPQNSQTRSGLQLHPEQTATDTNPYRLYAVVLHLTQLRRAFVPIRAASEAEAMRVAEQIDPVGITDWQELDTYTEAMFTLAAAEDEEGQGDE